MKSARLLLGLLALSTGVLRATPQDMPPTAPEQVAMSRVPLPPVMMLPGMRTPSSYATDRLTFPQPLISDVINVPNPFDSRKPGREGQTQVAYRLDKAVPVTVTLYDLMGQRVRRWQFQAGQEGGQEGVNYFWWDGTNEAGQKVSKGGYLAQIEIDLPGAAVSVVRKIGVIH